MHCPEGEEISSSLESFGVDLGDCIGVESCVDLRSDLSFLEKEIISDCQINKCRRDKGLDTDKMSMSMSMTMTMTMEKEKEYPPPIPCLARTENLPSHMPWIMKKYQSEDGRLIIREEKVKRHEYFQAHRSNGRLTLRLVPVNDSYFSSSSDNDDDDDDDDAEVTMTTENQNQSLKEDEESMPSPSSSSSPDEPCMETCGGSGGDGEYYKSVIRRNSSVLGMALPPFRPVHT